MPTIKELFAVSILLLIVGAAFVPAIVRAVDIQTCHCHRDVLPYYAAVLGGK